MVYILDTNAIGGLMRQEVGLSQWLSSLRPDDRLITCTTVRGEILFGLRRLTQAGGERN